MYRKKWEPQKYGTDKVCSRTKQINLFQQIANYTCIFGQANIIHQGRKSTKKWGGLSLNGLRQKGYMVKKKKYYATSIALP